MDPSRRSFLKGSAASAGALSMAAEAGSQIAAAQDVATVPVGAFQPAPGKKFDTRWLRSTDTIRAGRPFGRPYQAPFSYPA